MTIKVLDFFTMDFGALRPTHQTCFSVFYDNVLSNLFQNSENRQKIWFFYSTPYSFFMNHTKHKKYQLTLRNNNSLYRIFMIEQHYLKFVIV